jgi:hypothetical protein
MPEVELWIAVTRGIGGSYLSTKLEELIKHTNEVICLYGLEDMVSRLVLNLGWMDLELVDISFVSK